MEGSLFLMRLRIKNNFFMELNQKEGGVLKNKCIFYCLPLKKIYFCKKNIFHGNN